MELSAAEASQLQAELQALREENRNLRKLLREARERQAEGEAELIRSTYQPHHPHATLPACPHCPHCKPSEKSRKQLVQEFQMFSHRINSSFPMKKHLSDIHSSEDQQQELPSPPEEHVHQDPLIENICLFGPNLQEMRAAERHEKVAHQLYFPAGQAGLQAYGNYLYPERVGFKVVRQKKKDVDIDKILFRKSFKQQDCSIFIFFQCNPEQEVSHNPIAQDINPFRTLYNIGLQFSDYVYSDQPYKHPPDRSLSLTDDRIEDIHACQDAIVQGKAEKGDVKIVVPEQLRRDSSQYGQTCIFKSSFYLCVFTYFPFVDFFSQLLIRIVDQIKIKRMEKQSQKGKDYSQLDIRCVVEELNAILKEITPVLMKFTLQPAAKLSLSFGSQALSLSLEGSGVRESLIWDWAYRALRIFDKDSLYQVYCLVMLEQTVCVVCQNPYLLTFVIHLLVSLLPLPFHYPYPIVSIVFQEEFLETPFTTMLGINKGSKWLQANEPVFMQKMQGKVVLNLNDDQVKIKTKRKYKLPKSQKLKKIFATFYRRAEKFDSSSKRKEMLAREVSRQENELTAQLLTDLQSFYRQELLSYMPNKEIIDTIKSSTSGDNQTTMSANLLRDIEMYIKESRKVKQQDPMVSLLMQKQIFYVYLTQKYDIV